MRAAPKIPEWERIFQEMQLTAERVVQRPARRRGRLPRSSTPGSTRCSRSAAGLRSEARHDEARRAPPGSWRRPALLVIAVFFALPVVAGLALSLTDFDIYALADLSQPALRRPAELRATCCRRRCSGRPWATPSTSCVVGVPVSIAAVARRGVAARLAASRAGKAFFRTALFAPVVTTAVAVAVIWRYLLHTRYGLVNQALAAIGVAPVDWLGDPHWSMPAIILFAAWKNFGYNMIILLAALQAVPRELYEAARIDGAGALRASPT